MATKQELLDAMKFIADNTTQHRTWDLSGPCIQVKTELRNNADGELLAAKTYDYLEDNPPPSDEPDAQTLTASDVGDMPATLTGSTATAKQGE